ncbi:MAG: zinc ribbon domain-containing protein [Acidobacteria bacterium]|nr:zinc ribbon domain-containing protein [Acidobacteriota bacterium]
MFCPKCGHQQSVEDTRFCSRCGFRLKIIKAIVEGDDTETSIGSAVIDPAFRRRYLTFGSLLMFFFSFFVCLLAIFAPRESPVPIILLIFAWLFILFLIYLKPLFAFFFKGPTVASKHIAENETSPRNIANVDLRSRDILPSPTSQPAGSYFSPDAVTNNMVKSPPSVTEETTDLLRRDSDLS